MVVGATNRRVRVAIAISALALVAGCQSGSRTESAPPAGNPAATPSASATATPTTISVTPADGAKAVAPNTKVRVTAAGGTLESVVVANAAGKRIKGEFAPDRASWRATGELAFNSRYTVTAQASGPAGEATTRTTFRTVKPTAELTASVLPLDGETVGVGLPIVVYLSEPVDDRVAVERRLKVETSRPVEGSWHWVSDEEVHYRPRAYWPAHTKVALRADLRGVKAGKGLWGVKDRLIRFEIGDAVISTVNVKRLKMTVTRNGKVLGTIPVTAGKAGFTTRSGVKVISEKHRVKIMDAATIGIDEGDPEYYRLRVEYALRVTNSGEFVHAAPWSVGSQGSSRVSHGCVGMSTANASWLYGLTHRGDIVKVTGTSRELEPGNGFTEWNVPWEEWRKGSALA